MTNTIEPVGLTTAPPRPLPQESLQQPLPDPAKRGRRRRVLRLVAAALTLTIVAVTVGIGYQYLNHPGRLTSDPEYTGLARTVSGNTLSSSDGPAIDMTFDERFTHIGGQKFVLYGTADTEQHFFVEEHPDGSLKSMFWIQFESFLPDNNHTYDYSASPLRLQVDDFDFFTDTAPGTSAPIRLEWPGTDGALARGFLSDHGYSWPDDFGYARLVHIPDAAARQELLIIFVDDLAPSGLAGDSLQEGGRNRELWPDVETAHLDRIGEVMKLSRP